MGVFLGNGKNRAGRRSFRPMSEINVTPMVDVMLVLLVIFMVTAPLLTAGVPLELPKTRAAPLKGDDQPLTVSVNAAGKIFIQETEVTLETLAPRLGAITEAKTDTRIFVRGHKGIDYGRVMQVMTEIQQAGFSRIALVSDSSDAPAPARRR